VGSAPPRATGNIALLGLFGMVVMNRMLRVPAASALALAIAFSLIADPPVGGAPISVGAQGSDRSFGCTVKRLEVERRRLEVIVGVGHALRIVVLELSPTCGASQRGRHVALHEIQPGDIVRVHYQPAPATLARPARRVATMIDLVLAKGERGPP